MIERLGVGTDIVEISRIEKAIVRNSRFQRRVFSKSEIAYCEGKGIGKFASYAGIYAAKEAFFKALGLGFREGAWDEVVISHDQWGAPLFEITGRFKELMVERKYRATSVSISHAHDVAISYVVLY